MISSKILFVNNIKSALADFFSSNNYSKIAILVDENTEKLCLPSIINKNELNNPQTTNLNKVCNYIILLISKVLIRLSSAFKTLNLIWLLNLKTSFDFGTLLAIKNTDVESQNILDIGSKIAEGFSADLTICYVGKKSNAVIENDVK